jgi:DNA mismatch endonuclease (patch repair protein)
MDIFTEKQRSAMMARVRSRNSRTEMLVCSYLHQCGLRFRLHRSTLPGSPDIVLPSRRTVVFVHGCFWHRHPGCPRATTPKTRPDFWNEKFDRNVVRDARVQAALRHLGYCVELIWECEAKSEAHLRRLATRIKRRSL